jgi:hypothetical protein
LLMTSFFVCVLMPLSICRYGNSDFWRNDYLFPPPNPSPRNKTFGAIELPPFSGNFLALWRAATSFSARWMPSFSPKPNLTVFRIAK